VIALARVLPLLTARRTWSDSQLSRSCWYWRPATTPPGCAALRADRYRKPARAISPRPVPHDWPLRVTARPLVSPRLPWRETPVRRSLRPWGCLWSSWHPRPNASTRQACWVISPTSGPHPHRSRFAS